MKILMVEPGKAPKEKNISGTLGHRRSLYRGVEVVQEAVGGTIQAIYPFDEPVALICNDDGKLMNLPMCRSIHEIGDIIFGSFFVCAAPPGHRNFTSLSKEQIERYKERFRFPETFLRIGGDAIFVLRNL